MAYTYEIVKRKGHENFFETRHSGGFFERVWGVHPAADIAGTQTREIREIAFSPNQTVIEGVSRSRSWPRILAPLDFLLSQLSLVRLLVRIVRREDIDLIVATDPFYSGLMGYLLKKLTKRPLAIGVYANYDLAYETFGFIALPRLLPWLWLQNLVAETVLHSADLVIGGNRNNLQYALAHGGNLQSSAVIPIARNVQPCHMADPAARGDADEALRDLRIPPADSYLLMISRLIPVKFAEDGVRAMILAAKDEPNLIGIVAGEGPMRSELEALVASEGLAERIIFIGHVDQGKLSEVIPRCVTISPLTGMALVEAGLGGSPAVAYDADWQAEFVENGLNGYIVPMWDYRQMAERALELVRNPELHGRMSAAMREMAYKRADRDEIAKLEHAVFGQLLDQNRGASRRTVP
jgi:glycosyltransferase involved in cell wall biosynthesis